MATQIAYPFGIITSRGRIIEKFETRDHANEVLADLTQKQQISKTMNQYFRYKHSYIYSKDKLKIVKVPDIWSTGKIKF